MRNLIEFASRRSELPVSGFTRRALEQLRHIQYRPIVTQEDREEIYRLRYEMYRADDLLAPNDSRMLHDPLDDAEGAMAFGTYIDGRLVSTIRLTRLCSEHRKGPSMVAYPEVVEPLLVAGKVLIDPARFAIDKTIAHRSPLLPHFTLRLAVMACLHFRADYCTSVVQASHRAYYRHFLLAKETAGAKAFPGVTCLIHLLMTNVPESEDAILGKHPFFRSTDMEQRMLFRHLDGEPAPLAVTPTAEFAIRNLYRDARPVALLEAAE